MDPTQDNNQQQAGNQGNPASSNNGQQAAGNAGAGTNGGQGAGTQDSGYTAPPWLNFNPVPKADTETQPVPAAEAGDLNDQMQPPAPTPLPETPAATETPAPVPTPEPMPTPEPVPTPEATVTPEEAPAMDAPAKEATLAPWEQTPAAKPEAPAKPLMDATPMQVEDSAFDSFAEDPSASEGNVDFDPFADPFEASSASNNSSSNNQKKKKRKKKKKPQHMETPAKAPMPVSQPKPAPAPAPVSPKISMDDGADATDMLRSYRDKVKQEEDQFHKDLDYINEEIHEEHERHREVLASLEREKKELRMSFQKKEDEHKKLVAELAAMLGVGNSLTSSKKEASNHKDQGMDETQKTHDSHKEQQRKHERKPKKPMHEPKREEEQKPMQGGDFFAA